MSYQTGVTSSITDLLNTVFTFALTQGFTVGPTWTHGTSPVHDAYSLLKDGVYFTFSVPRTGTPYLFLNTATGINPALTQVAQPGAHPQACRVDNIGGPHVGYHFFCDGLALNVVVEIVTNVFVHFNFGSMIKNGDFIGGQFVSGMSVNYSSANTLNQLFSYYHLLPYDGVTIGSAGAYGNSNQGHVRTPIAPPTVPLGQPGATGARAYCTGWASNGGRPLLDVSPNAFNGRATLIPFNFVQASSGDSGPYYQLGTVGNARAVNIANLNPKEVINTDWMVFPISQKNGPATVYINSANYGIAYQK